MSNDRPTLPEITSAIEATMRRLFGDTPPTKGDIDSLRALIEARLPVTPATPAVINTTRLRGDAAAAKYCGYKSRPAFLAFAARHRIFEIREGRAKFWLIRDLDRALRPKPENPAVWRPGRF